MYSTGKITTTANTTKVVGTNTKWKDNNSLISPEQVILIQNGATIYINSIASIQSNTEMTLSFPVPATVKEATYNILTTMVHSVSDAANKIVAMNNANVQFSDILNRWATETGTITVTLPDGTKQQLRTAKEMDKQLDGKFDKAGGILTGSLVVPELYAQNAVYIGDNDSGFHADGDGSVALWNNGQQSGCITTQEFKHFGKIVSVGGLYAADGRTEFQQDGDIKGGKWGGLLSAFMESRYGKKNTTGEGWWKCGDTGLMIQWGEVSSPNKVWFPTSFSWRCYAITFGQKNTEGWMTSPMADNIDKAGFSFCNNGRSQNGANNQNVSDKVFYMAIGG